MMNTDMPKIIEQVIEAHGGVDRWKALEAVEATISVRGFLFKAKRRPILNRIRVRASARVPEFTFYDVPQTGQNSVFLGDEEVRIVGVDNQVVESRSQPRDAIRSLRRQLYWDALDFAYFGGYATWNYLVTPFLFLKDGFHFDKLEPLPQMPEFPLRLQVSFPDSLPTHCTKQTFYFDRDYLLRRLDYTAEVVSRLAHAAHICDNYQDFDGIKIPTRRRVLPLFFSSKPLSGLVIVAIDVHEFSPIISAPV
jgi:hypothetical protein